MRGGPRRPDKRRGPLPAPPPEGPPLALMIERMGRRGEGVAAGPGGTLAVPYALPGEAVIAAPAGERARLVGVTAPSTERITPFCPYFGRCGGCALQHWDRAPYAAWKRGLLVEALARAGLDVPVEPLLDAHGAGRRRATFHARIIAGRAVAGFMEARSHRLLPLERCPVLDPALADAPRLAAALAHPLRGLGKPLDVQLTLTEGGVDADLRGSGPLPDALRLALTRAAEAADLARLSLHGEVLIERRAPALAVGRARLVPDAGGFLQATSAGEAALAAVVLGAATGARRAVDLFAGSGAFALRLAEGCAVRAVDANGPALDALSRAARGAPGLKPVETERRDLFRRPYGADELKGFDLAVMDPPRAGALDQARALAASAVPVVVSVACDAATFARDLAVLVAGGYAVERVVPVDQFAWTAHVEAAAVLRRGKGGARL